MRRRVGGDGGHVDRLLAAARTCWGDTPGGAGCVVAETYDEDLRVVVRTLTVARAVCGLLSARLAVLTTPDWMPLARAYGAVQDLRPEESPVALVTSRADRAVPRELPVVHVHGTGTLKAYAIFPDQGTCSFQDELPARVGAFFERHVWPHRELIRPSAERVAWRAKSGYQVRTDTERRQLRHHGCARLGLDADRPTIAVFGHAPGRDTELFDATAEFAAADESANWLFLDPVPDPVPAAGRPRVRCVRGSLSTTMLWSMTDVGVAFGDSDLPGFGIPVIQAGWSEGGACGATHVPASPSEHRGLLREAIARHAKGETVLGPEQRERARLWSWLRRCGADVPSQLLPHWEQGDDYARALAVNLRHVEPGGDPLYGAVRRLWERREPMLTRLDLHDPAALAALAAVGSVR
ncbi:hypothetical protein [Nonomuraea gerenzanensis]|uniref:Uncharacterized protein n=1 Tax=Nonomuraea gerenzanensis TaxID=93944 RepID=A0A1M4DW85_9ACTN|nr:hypothetical protein [Nonomuraea gerenzanensis]UBU13177.1 hypothetical protein LCN96_54575 [Nonomuraea gerenzanensis]SBO90824.1 hypothetical protein BN4615_P338 [Nonomuraea gerenzanensis]